MSVSNISMQDDNIACRRAETVDRRKAHFKASILSFFNARRQTVRRDVGDAVSQLGEMAKPCSFGTLCGLLTFLVFDAIFSLSILQIAGSEASPLAHIMFDNTWQVFFLVKSLVAAASLVFLAVYKSVGSLKILNNAQALLLFVSFYIVMLVYQVTLIV